MKHYRCRDRDEPLFLFSLRERLFQHSNRKLKQTRFTLALSMRIFCISSKVLYVKKENFSLQVLLEGENRFLLFQCLIWFKIERLSKNIQMKTL